jgi:6-phosphogluconolactonase
MADADARADVRVYRDPPAVARGAAELVTRAAEQAISARGVFSLVLSGGSTPKLLYENLADLQGPYRGRTDWSKIEVYFGDERAVPPESDDSNYRMAKQSLLSRVPIPLENVHRMRGEIDPEQAAVEYGKMLKARFGESGGPDLTLLGMGEDGHTASLFPFTPALDENLHRCVAQFVEKSTTGPSWRITLAAPFINRSAAVAVLVTGAGKAQRLKEVLHGPREAKRLPIQLVAPASGNLVWLVDSAAAADLPG